MPNIQDLANDNLPKGAIRLLVIVALVAVCLVTSAYYFLNKDSTTYDRRIYAECLLEIKRCRDEIKICNQERSEEYKYYIESIIKMTKEVENIKKTINKNK